MLDCPRAAVSMEFFGVVGGAAFAALFVICGFCNFQRSRRADGPRCNLYNTMTVTLSSVASLCYLYSGVYEYLDNGLVSFKDAVASFTWILAALSWNHFKCNFLVVLWVIFSLAWNCFSLSPYFFSGHLNIIISPSNLGDVVSCPVSLILVVTSTYRGTKNDEIRQPLIKKTDEESHNAGVWSRLTFQWLNPLFQKGRNGILQFLHIPPIPKSETSLSSSLSLEESQAKQKCEIASLPKAIARAVWKPLLINGVFAAYVGPLLITNLVNYLSSNRDDGNKYEGLILAVIFFVSKTAESVTQRQWYFGTQRIGIRVRSALTVQTYKKSLTTSSSPSNGKMVSLVNVDVERIGDFFWYIHGVWLLPFQVTLALFILYYNLGFAPSLAAVITTIVIMVSNTPLANKQQKYQSKIMEGRDLRIKATSEALQSIRVLKLYSWEASFMKKIIDLRATERKWLRLYLYISSLTVFLFWASPTLVSVVTFAVCIIMKQKLTTGSVLSALATVRILQEPIYNLPELISMITQTKISLDRVSAFLKEDDKRSGSSYCGLQDSNVAVEVVPGEYSWEGKANVRITEKIQIIKGWKVAVCGHVGSGKSSFLSSLLGEIPRISGSQVRIRGKRAYVPQSAWVQTGTVKENILFGRYLDGELYRRVVEGCALGKDFDLWENKDETLVEERGVNMSGGQKQRIQLARAVYSDSDVYILDDPFSAVDAHTATHLFNKCVMETLGDKTVVYATHQVDFLEAADLVLVMKDGVLVQSGKYNDLIKDEEGDLVKQMEAHSKSLAQMNYVKSKMRVKKSEITREGEGGRLLKQSENELEGGRVGSEVYGTFIKAAYGGALVPVILLSHILFYCLQMGSNYWVAWASEEKNRVSKEKLLTIFVVLSGLSSVFILARAILLAKIALESAQNLYLKMITSIFRAPVQFFESVSSSKILHSSSTDQATLDTDIPYRVAGLAFALIQLFTIVVLMSQVVWKVLLLFLFIFSISFWYQMYYLPTARELTRMVGVKKSPILHHFSETISGAPIIRGFNQEGRFEEKIYELIDDYSRVVFHNVASMEWLSLRINFFFNLGFFFVLILLVNLPSSSMDATLSGLVATYGLNLSVLQAWVIWNVCNVESKMISVERVLKFTSIAQEAPEVIQHSRPTETWPETGEIELKNLSVQHNCNLPMVLKDLTCKIPGGKKTAIVGRTGSGKSTLIQALFRLVEPSIGKITIDSKDISKIGLRDLRNRIGIIPQDPTLFQGTVRFNLDPLEEHADLELWHVLEKCRLGKMVKKDDRGLDAPVAEDGRNWSVGERQLVCLARVLLRKRRILVLDEATASIDTATDNVIQETIREETEGCSVITVAHRIPTVIDNDLVMVLHEGRIVEYDSPQRLLENDASSFADLVFEFFRFNSCR